MYKDAAIILLTLFMLVLFSITGCKKKEVPVLDTSPISEISGTSAICGGNIIDDGGETILSRGVCWSKNIKPDISDKKTTDGAGAGSFSSSVNNLEPATVYFIRAYAMSSSGTGYGMVFSFTTLGQSPAATTGNVTNITTTTATVSGNINANYISTAVTFEYGNSLSYGGSVSAIQSPVTGSSNSFVTVDISGLTPGTTYHYRVKAENSLGITYGYDMTFITLGQAPTAYTQAPSNIQSTTAILKGLVNANYISTAVTFEYGTSTSYGSNVSANQNPVTGNTLKTVSAVISGLTEGVTYHFRIKAENSLGVTYGDDLTFDLTSKLTDIEGNVYSTIIIGSQIWMAENLRTTKFNDNSVIPLEPDSVTWFSLSTPAFCWYNNDEATNKITYGALYNWYTVASGKLCPAGWHVPSDTEFSTLTNFLGGESVAGGKIKEVGTDHWLSPNTSATNESGFNALPAGQRGGAGEFVHNGMLATWWSSTPYNIYKPWYRCCNYNLESVFVGSGSLNSCGFSIRCIKD